MGVTYAELNRATLARQLLLGRKRLSVREAVHAVVALQAQEPASPYVALWNRVAGFDPADLDTAFADHTVVKATLMRVTLHAVDASDHAAFHDAMQVTLRAARLNDRRFRQTGLTPADADVVIPELLAFAARPRTGAELEAWVDERVGERPKPGVWWALRQLAPLVHAPTGATWTFGTRPSFVAAPATTAPQDHHHPTLRWLIRRYLEGFGPAGAQDVSQFALLSRAAVREALAAMADSLVTIDGPDGELFDVPDAPVPAGDTAAPPRLLGMWDSIQLAYADRGRVIPPEHRQHVTRRNGDVLPTLLVDGYVRGVWRPVDGGIEATAFERLSEEAWAGLASEAADLVTVLAARDPVIYRRYGHWWTSLPPGAEVRLLPARSDSPMAGGVM